MIIAISIYHLSTQLLSQSLNHFLYHSLIQTHQPQLSNADCNHHNNDQSLSEIRLIIIYFNYFGLQCMEVLVSQVGQVEGESQ